MNSLAFGTAARQLGTFGERTVSRVKLTTCGLPTEIETEDEKRQNTCTFSVYVPSPLAPASPRSSCCPAWTSSGSACWTYQNWRNAGLVWLPLKSRITKTTVTMMERGGEGEEEEEGGGVGRRVGVREGGEVWKWTEKTNINTLKCMQLPGTWLYGTSNNHKARKDTDEDSIQDKNPKTRKKWLLSKRLLIYLRHKQHL